MTTRTVLLAALPALLLLGCDDAAPIDTERRAAIAVWDALEDAAETPGTYWYEEHNCPLMVLTGTASVVQVTDGVAALVGRRTVCRASCELGLQRYGDLTPATLRALIAECPGDALVEFDAEGVQTFCRRRPDDCFDSCDEGYHVVRWEHGVYQGDATTDEVCEP